MAVGALWLFLPSRWVGLQCVIVVLPFCICMLSYCVISSFAITLQRELVDLISLNIKSLLRQAFIYVSLFVIALPHVP